MQAQAVMTEAGDLADAPQHRVRVSIIVKLLVAFLTISLLPIGVLAVLSLQELQETSTQHSSGIEAPHGAEGAAEGEAGHVEGEAHQEPGSAPVEQHHEGMLFGFSIATIELAVAVISLFGSVLMALYIGRTLVRPLKELESAMSRVEHGDLDVAATVRSNDEIGHLAASFNQMVMGLQREVLIRDLFGQYVTPEVADVAISMRGQLDGQLAECTVLFSDIRNFTGLTEQLPPSDLIVILNRYFSLMSAAVVEEGGMVNKFGGDSLLAVFGTPLNPQVDHAAHALRAALRMRASLLSFNAEQRAAGQPEIRFGIGIATGRVVAGNVGSQRKVEYTVIGETVNLAARLQSMTRELEHDCLVSAETAQSVTNVIPLTAIGEVAIRGMSKPVEVFALG